MYSFHGSRPAPLPQRIRLPDGGTRTDPTKFTAEEIAAAGFTGPYEEPPYDPATHRLDWNGAYVLIQLPPVEPEADWPAFRQALLNSDTIDDALQARAGVPGAVLALPGALQAAEAGDVEQVINVLIRLQQRGILSQVVKAEIAAAAVAANLPPAVLALIGASAGQAIEGWDPPSEPTRGYVYTAPDGSRWAWTQPRRPNGTFVPDDPGTPEIESALTWLPADS